MNIMETTIHSFLISSKHHSSEKMPAICWIFTSKLCKYVIGLI